MLWLRMCDRMTKKTRNGEKAGRRATRSGRSGRPRPRPSTLRHASFFSGIGGFDLGFDHAGFRTTSQSEVDRYCLSVLQRHWPSVTRLGDIATLDGASIPVADVWTAGFPCQDVSLARGNHLRPGFDGRNSSLFFEFFDLVQQCEPRIVVLENVLGLLSSNSGDDFAVVLSRFTNAGYGVAWRVLNTRYFGAPQSRQRVFVVAVRENVGAAARIVFDERPEETEDPRTAFREVHCCDVSGAYVPRISFCVAATSGRHTGNDWSRTYVAYDDRVRRPTPGETEALQGFPALWTIPGEDYRGRFLNFDSERYRALGNAVSVPVAEWLGHRVRMELARRTAAPGDGMRLPDQTMVENWSANPGRVRKRDLSEGSLGKWGSGGLTNGRKVALDFAAADQPSEGVQSKFVDLLSRDEELAPYFISANAAQGMLRRADGLGRRFFEPLDRALRRLALAR